jgi:hypothetical protein
VLTQIPDDGYSMILRLIYRMPQVGQLLTPFRMWLILQNYDTQLLAHFIALLTFQTIIQILFDPAKSHTLTPITGFSSLSQMAN